MNIILAAVPFFFLLIAIELLIDWRRGTGYYRLTDAITSLSLGVLSRVTEVTKKLIPFTIYYVAYEYIQVFSLTNSVFTWIFAFLVYDFFYYWLHRMSHEINILWAAHVVHHSSEDYNLTTALRQTSGNMLGWVFFLPMAVMGVPPEIFISVGALNLVYQFWVHTQHIDQLGWMEKVFVTPSNHRVHHAQNSRYIDCNYGGVFILWDRLFGTFRPECKDDPVIFGVRTPLNSWNPLWANLQVYLQLLLDAWRTQSWKDKCRIWFMPTGWRPDDVVQQYPLQKTNLTHFQKFDTASNLLTGIYGVVQHVLAIALALWLMIQGEQFVLSETMLLGSFVAFSLFANSQILAAHKAGVWLEVFKWCALPVVLMLLDAPAMVLYSSVALSLVHLTLLAVITQRWPTATEA
ncbi:MAG: sterol desaturase family protein [Aestuariibacter sp.]